MRYFLGSVFLLGLISWASDRVRVQLHPLDVLENQGNHYPTSIDQIESDGERLFLRSAGQTEILVIDASGRLLQVIGGSGDHPSEFGHSGILGMAVSKEGLWAFDNDMVRLRYFENGKYQKSFRMPGFNIWFSHPTSNAFAFKKDTLIVPAEPTSDHLARILNSDGGQLGWLGDPLPEFEKGSYIRGINDTLWVLAGDRWICVHKFYPLITVYDPDFNIVQQFEVTSSPIARTHGGIERFQPTTQMTAPIPVFTDAKWFDEALYLMAGGHLHQVDLGRETVASVAQFYGVGEDFKAVEAPFLTMFFFTFLADGRLVIAHPGLLWNHDLWTAQFPFSVRNHAPGPP